MSIIYYILGIGFFIFLTIVCYINFTHYSDLLYRADVDKTGDTYTGLTQTQLTILMAGNIIVATLSIFMTLYCLVILFLGEPKPAIEIPLDKYYAGAIMEEVIGKQYFKEIKKRKDPRNALEAAAKYATRDLMVSLYNNGASNLEAQTKAKNLIVDYIKEKYPSGKFELNSKFIYNEEYENLLKEKNIIANNIDIINNNIDKIIKDPKYKRKVEFVENLDKDIDNVYNLSYIKANEKEYGLDLIEIKQDVYYVRNSEYKINNLNKILEKIKEDIKKLDNTKIIAGRPIDVIKGAIDADITFFDKFKGLFVKPYQGIF